MEGDLEWFERNYSHLDVEIVRDVFHSVGPDPDAVIQNLKMLDPRQNHYDTGVEWASRRELINQLQEFTACDEDAAMVLLGDADWDLRAAVEAFIRKQAEEEGSSSGAIAQQQQQQQQQQRAPGVAGEGEGDELPPGMEAKMQREMLSGMEAEMENKAESFAEITGASKEVAVRLLEQTGWRLENAIIQYTADAALVAEDDDGQPPPLSDGHAPGRDHGHVSAGSDTPPSDDVDEAGSPARCAQPAGKDTGGGGGKEGGVLAATRTQTARDVKVCDGEDDDGEEEEEEEEPWGPEGAKCLDSLQCSFRCLGEDTVFEIWRQCWYRRTGGDADAMGDAVSVLSEMLTDNREVMTAVDEEDDDGDSASYLMFKLHGGNTSLQRVTVESIAVFLTDGSLQSLKMAAPKGSLMERGMSVVIDMGRESGGVSVTFREKPTSADDFICPVGEAAYVHVVGWGEETDSGRGLFWEVKCEMAALFSGAEPGNLRARVGEGCGGADGEGELHQLAEPLWVMGRIGVKLSDGHVVYEWPPPGYLCEGDIFEGYWEDWGVDAGLDFDDEVSGLEEIRHSEDGFRAKGTTPVDGCRDKGDAGVSIWDDGRGCEKVNREDWRQCDDKDDDDDDDEAGMELPTEEEEVLRVLPWLSDANREAAKTGSECESRIIDGTGPAPKTDAVGGEAGSEIDVERNGHLDGAQYNQAGRGQGSSDGEEFARAGEGEVVDEDEDAKIARMMAEEEEEQRRLAEEEDARMARMLSEQEEEAAVGGGTSPGAAQKRGTLSDPERRGVLANPEMDEKIAKQVAAMAEIEEIRARAAAEKEMADLRAAAREEAAAAERIAEEEDTKERTLQAEAELNDVVLAEIIQRDEEAEARRLRVEEEEESEMLARMLEKEEQRRRDDRLGARSNTAASIVNHAMSANSSPVTGVAAASSKRKTLFEGKASPSGVVGVIHPSAKAGMSPRLDKGGGEGADMLSIMFPDCDRDVIAEVLRECDHDLKRSIEFLLPPDAMEMHREEDEGDSHAALASARKLRRRMRERTSRGIPLDLGASSSSKRGNAAGGWDALEEMERGAIMERFAPSLGPQLVEEVLNSTPSLQEARRLLMQYAEADEPAAAGAPQFSYPQELKGFAAAAATAPDTRRYTPVNQRQQPTDRVVARLIEARRSTSGPGAGKDALPFGAVGDGHEYRADAKRHQTRRNYFFDLARQATAAGDKERAGRYADIGSQHNVKAQQLEGLARRSFVDTNHRNVDSHTLDLHYLRVHDAMKELEDFIKHHQRQAEGHKEYDVDIITGAGRHSQGGIARIRPQVEQWLSESGFKYYAIGDGRFKVRLAKRGW